ncbi:alanine racemase [Candidatus Kirkpatrickella diaphorinae]|uniref:Alanine racemase n=1 Tax=Candidatus Kirkpatrickella diaphorinae TaxID=2984322 RepID=A0ABY6GHI8_9PROT|nr:alanine racemase [Candidatus Kirkpatrickella diaphorinae]UYH50772.1 alanine racemase [Candidatus Kirkpatrickella diaphorinae]
MKHADPPKQYDPAMALSAPDNGGLLTINLYAIGENYQRLVREVGPSVDVAAAVKANAYGLGVAQVAPVLYAAGCRRFFVATRDEALELRAIMDRCADGQSGQDVTIHLLNGPFTDGDAALAAARISPIINSLTQLTRWKSVLAAHDDAPQCVLQFDTGMSRYGMSLAEAQRLAREPELLDRVSIAFTMSHLANADAASDPRNAAQLAAFEAILACLPPGPSSIAASSGIFLGKRFHRDVVRPGYALYGGNPTPGRPNPMEPVIALYARMIQARTVPEGAEVGYGSTFRAPRVSRIATLAIGYADGLLRSAGGKISVVHPAFPDIALPCIGRISMDSMAIDITDLPITDLAENTLFEMIGPHRPLDDVATALSTIGYEVLTSLGARHFRVYHEDPS